MATANNTVLRFDITEKMPALFLGHGSPMNAIEENQFTKGFEKIVKDIPTPKAILCISAHWSTKGTFVTIDEQPKTIHDFGGFPRNLYEVQYPAPGCPGLAKEIQKIVHSTTVIPSSDWGLDHGCWGVLKFLYPDANIPIVELSVDYQKPASFHYQLGKELAELRRKGILIVASGNTIHNLRMVAWDKLDGQEYGYDWALLANKKMRTMIESGDHKSLIEYEKQGTEFRLSIPTPDHYFPLLYILGMEEENEKRFIFNDGLVGGSLNMLSVKIG